jgi:hypothetical protein
MTTPATYLILSPADEDGVSLVIGASVGDTDLIEDGQLTIRRTGAAAQAWIGWSRLANGTYEAPAAPPAPTGM